MSASFSWQEQCLLLKFPSSWSGASEDAPKSPIKTPHKVAGLLDSTHHLGPKPQFSPLLPESWLCKLVLQLSLVVEQAVCKRKEKKCWLKAARWNSGQKSCLPFSASAFELWTALSNTHHSCCTARCQGGVLVSLSEGRDTEWEAVGLYPGRMVTEPGEATRFPPSESKSRKQVYWTQCLQVPWLSHCVIARECLGLAGDPAMTWTSGSVCM